MSEEKPNITVTPRAIILEDTMVWLPYEEYQRLLKAIPIEFIEKFKKEFRAVASVKAVIEWLLENWEKENEANRR